MKTKILLTNGKKFVEVWWILHEGTDVYCGPSMAPSMKVSYHGSGQIHTKYGGELLNKKTHLKLSEFVGEYGIQGIAVSSLPSWFDDEQSFKPLSGHQTESYLVADIRSIPSDVTANIAVGLLEPGRLDLLSEKVQSLSVQQILVATGESPWVYAYLHFAQNPRPESATDAAAN